MIVAGVFEKIFKNMELTYNEYSDDLTTFTEVTKPVQYHYGDLKELSKWIRGRNGEQKYPLIWYIIEPVEEGITDTIVAGCCILLFTSTKVEYYNNTRALINYTSILDKLSTQIKRMLEENNVIELIFKDEERVFKQFDIPNYGVDLDQFDFTSNLPKGTKSLTVDVVDARRIEFNARFYKSNINCLTEKIKSNGYTN